MIVLLLLEGIRIRKCSPNERNFSSWFLIRATIFSTIGIFGVCFPLNRWWRICVLFICVHCIWWRRKHIEGPSKQFNKYIFIHYVKQLKCRFILPIHLYRKIRGNSDDNNRLMAFVWALSSLTSYFVSIYHYHDSLAYVGSIVLSKMSSGKRPTVNFVFSFQRARLPIAIAFIQRHAPGIQSKTGGQWIQTTFGNEPSSGSIALRQFYSHTQSGDATIELAQQ